MPTAPPNNFTGYVESSTSAVLSWTAPNQVDQNGIITRYVIDVANTKDGTSYYEYSTSKTITLTLKPWNVYEVAVAAETVAGIGPYTGHLELETPQDGAYMKNNPFII